MSLEDAGGFGLPQSLDTTFERLVDTLHATCVNWPPSGLSAGPGEDQYH